MNDISRTLVAIMTTVMILLFSSTISAKGQCSMEIEALTPYQGQIGEVRVKEGGPGTHYWDNAITGHPGIAYEIFYRFEGKAWRQIEVVLRPTDALSDAEGAYLFVWGEHSPGRQMPYLISTRDCKTLQVQRSRKTSDLP